MKAYADLEQSKKLAGILPHESADMFYDGIQDLYKEKVYNIPKNGSSITVRNGHTITKRGIEANLLLPCWSLASLLEVLPKIVNNETLFIETSAALWHIGYRNIYTARADNPIDACVAMIEKLNELNLL
jgi:hypothetical protein